MQELERSVVAARVRVVLVGTTHPGNIGAAARAMKTMGLEELVLVAPQRFPAAEASARATGADDVLARARVVSRLAEAIDDCVLVLGTSARARRLEWPQLDPRQAAGACADVPPGAAVAFVFGRESSGLSNEELDLCQALVRIPTAPGYASLNLAAAVQVIGYELMMLGGVARTSPQRKAAAGGNDASGEAVTQAEMEGLYAHLDQALTDIGYLDPEAPKLLRRRLRRLFNRARPDRAELNILRGILSAAQAAARRAAR